MRQAIAPYVRPTNFSHTTYLSTTMRLSQEAVIAIVGVIVNLPAFALLFWDLWKKYKCRAHEPGKTSDLFLATLV
jgi:hypothetical protein